MRELIKMYLIGESLNVAIKSMFKEMERHITLALVTTDSPPKLVEIDFGLDYINNIIHEKKYIKRNI
jgi:hypothetical protein